MVVFVFGSVYMVAPMRLYTRYEHGSLPVDVVEGDRREFVLHLPGGPVHFPTQRGFLSYLYGKDLHIPFTRYFKLYDEPLLEEVESILDLCFSPYPVGIDLGKRGHEVRKILFAHFGRKIAALRLDPQEVLQETYRKILVANRGKRPFDPWESSFGHYVYMVCNSALLNYRKKDERRRRRERMGVAILEDRKRVIVDAGTSGGHIAETGLIVDTEGHLACDMAVSSLCSRIGDHTEDRRLACRIVSMIHGGYTRKELAERLGVPVRRVKAALDIVKENAAKWARDEGIIFGGSG